MDHKFVFLLLSNTGHWRESNSWCLLLKGNKTSIKCLFCYLANEVNTKEVDFSPGQELWSNSFIVFFSPSLPNQAAPVSVGFCSCSTTKLFFKALRHSSY